jgi:hypothetical protein
MDKLLLTFAFRFRHSVEELQRFCSARNGLTMLARLNFLPVRPAGRERFAQMPRHFAGRPEEMLVDQEELYVPAAGTCFRRKSAAQAEACPSINRGFAERRVIARQLSRGHAPYAGNLGDTGRLAGFLLWRRYRAGGSPNTRLKARLNAASDS